MADENKRIEELKDAMEKMKSAPQYVSGEEFTKITGKTPEQLGLELDSDNEIGFTQVHSAHTEASEAIKRVERTKHLNPKLQAMFEGGTEDYLSTVRTEENDTAKMMKQLLDFAHSKNDNYIHENDIKTVTGKTAEELKLKLDDEKEANTRDIKAYYNDNAETTNKFQEFLDTEASEQDYVDVVSGKYGDTVDWTYSYGYSMRDALTQSKHNSPANNFKVAQELSQADDEGGELDIDSYRKNFARHMNLGWDGIEHIISSEDIWGHEQGYVIDNDSVNDDHIYKMVERYPEFVAQGLTHDKVNDRAREMFLDKDENWEHLDQSRLDNIVDKNARSQTPDGHVYNDERDKISSKLAHQVLNNRPGFLREKNLDLILGSVDDHDRNNWIDKTLGIDGGKHQHTLPDESEDFNADNWDNWEEGSNASMDMGLRNAIASSRHLTDEQADHIKRHGSFDEKYQLYHNKQIDTKHGVEMFSKWKDNHDEHGYDSDELIEKFKEDKEDVFGFDELPEDVQEELTTSDDYYEHIDEVAEQNYTISDYMDDNEDSIIEQMKQNDEISDELMEHVDEAVRENYSDWTAKNPEAAKNVGNPQYDALDSLNDEHDLENTMFTADELGENGVKALTKLKVTPDEDGDYDGDQILEKLSDFGGPSQIDYDGHDELHITEHPEYDERYTESVDTVYQDALNNRINNVSPWEISDKLYLYEDHRESTGYTDAQSEAGDDWKADRDNYSEHLDNLYENSHSDDRFLPDHIAEAMPEFAEIRKERIRAARSSNIESLPNRAFEHSYGEDQHHHELLKDYADANGGSMDVGKMHKKFPNLKETWKKIFNGKGKLTSGEIDQKIKDIPKTQYDATYGEWKADKMQNVNSRNQVIFRLDHSDESLKEIFDHENPDVKEMFKKVQNVSKQSGHPTNDRTIAWARVDTSDPDHWMIDEVQSDFGKTVTKYLKEQGAGSKADAVKTISDIHKDWRENLTNHVINTAKTHGTQKISTHSPESKASHTGNDTIHTVYKDSYKKVPKKMGFQESEMKDLPLTEKGQRHFKTTTEDNQTEDVRDHTEAFEEHMSYHNLHSQLAHPAFKHSDESHREAAAGMANQHKKMADLHAKKLGTASVNLDDANIVSQHDNEDRKFAIENIKAGKDPYTHEADAKVNKPMGKPSMEAEHKGYTLDLTPEGLKKAISEVVDLIKAEMSLGRIRKSMFDHAFDLAKGSRQRKVKFQPQRDVSEKEHQKVDEWVQHSQDREEIPEIHPNAKKRALHKLHSLTEVRTHPKTGERMFLLHRGMSAEEHGANSQGSKTSWTPNVNTAQHFAKDAQRGHDEDGIGKQAQMKSAWIPESQVHHVLPAVGDSEGGKVSGVIMKEHEIIVQPHDFTYASEKHSKSDVHARISDRASVANKYDKRMPTKGDESRSKVESHKTKMMGRHNIENIPKLAASEVLNNDLDKGEIGRAARGLVLAGAVAMGAHEATKTPTPQKAPQAQEKSVEGTNLDPSIRNRPSYKQAQDETSGRSPASIKPDPVKQKQHILNSISDVESSGGKNIKHAQLPKHGIHQGEKAFGKYGLTPLLIRETIKKHPDLQKQYGHLANFKGSLFHEGMNSANKDGGLEHEIASRHYDRLAEHFDHDPAKIGHAWLNGITGTKKAINRGSDLHNHWHVKKVMGAYNKRKK